MGAGAAANSGVIGAIAAPVLSPYSAMDYLWDGAGIVDTGGFATSWTAALGGVTLTQVQANGCAYLANWRNGQNAIVSSTGRLQNSVDPVLTPQPVSPAAAICYMLAGQFPAAVAGGAYKAISCFGGKAFPFVLAGTGTTVQLESWEETLDHGTYSLDISQWLGQPFFAVVRHKAGAYKMYVRVGGTTFALPMLSGPSPTPSGQFGWTMGGTADVNNMWDAPMSMGGIRISELTDIQMIALCEWSKTAFNLPDAISPYSFGGDIELNYNIPPAVGPGGYYTSVPNSGVIGGSAAPPVLDTNTMPETNFSIFSSGTSALYRGNPSIQHMRFSVANAFKRLHTATGGTMLLRVKTINPVLSTSFGIMYSDMQGLPPEVGVHLKFFSNGVMYVTLGNGAAISDVPSAAGLIIPNTFYTLGLRSRAGDVDPSKIKLEGFINGLKVVETAELTPSLADASMAETIGSYCMGLNYSENMYERWRFLTRTLTDEEMLRVHDWFVSH